MAAGGLDKALVDAAKKEGAFVLYASLNEDAGDPRWKGRILLEAEDVEVLLALGERQYGGDQARLREAMGRIAADGPEPHKGHTETQNLMIAGQGDLFWGAHGHTAQRDKEKGAPIEWMKSEAVITVDGISLIKNAPHPNAAKLFTDWYVGEEGQKVLASVKRIPARPGAGDPTLIPQKQYVSGPALAPKFGQYQKLWQEIFNIR